MRVFRKGVVATALAVALFARPSPGRARAAGQSLRTPVDVSALGPQIGETIPEFRLIDQRGRPQTLASIALQRGAMLVFVRSADW